MSVNKFNAVNIRAVKNHKAFLQMITKYIVLINLLLCFISCNNPNDRIGPNYNVILITIDTLRKDHLNLYGYKENTAPNISAFAKECIVFKNAISQSSWTLPAFASIMTGVYPKVHHAINVDRRIDSILITLAESLKNNGYKTGAAVSHIFVGEKYGFGKGFDYFDSSNLIGSEKKTTSENITKLGIDWIKRRNKKKFFLWLHYFDPHDEFLYHTNIKFEYTKEINENEKLIYSDWNKYDNNFMKHYNNKKNIYISLYNGEIFYTDYYVNELLLFLKNNEYLKNTIIIITSDHGESFGNHELYGHSNYLYSDLIYVPLIVYIPKNKHEVIPNIVETRDIMPTILDLLKIKKPYYLDNNLLTKKREFAFSEVENRDIHRRIAIMNNSWKLIYTTKENLIELYDLDKDPNELNNLAESNHKLVKNLKKILFEKMGIIELDKENTKRLKSLGYIK